MGGRLLISDIIKETKAGIFHFGIWGASACLHVKKCETTKATVKKREKSNKRHILKDIDAFVYKRI